MRKWMALICGAVFLASAGMAVAQDVIRIGTEGAYPPWNMTLPDGQLAGFEIDLANALCERVGARCEFVTQDWDGMIPALLGGRYDAIMAGMSITDERRQRMSFTSPYIVTPIWFLAANNSPLRRAETLADLIAGLNGRVIGVQTATTHQRFVEQEIPGARLRAYDTQEQLNLDMSAGRIDVGLADSMGWSSFLQSPEGQHFSQIGPSMSGREFPIFGEGVGIGLRQRDTALRERLETALCAMQREGALAALSMQWFGIDGSVPCAD